MRAWVEELVVYADEDRDALVERDSEMGIGENEAYDGLGMVQLDTTGEALLGNEAQS